MIYQPIKATLQYIAMERKQRELLLPERNVCSLYPSKDWGDAFSTGNGFQQVELFGNPYNEKIAFSHEALYEPLYEITPEPPDLTGVMPTVRSLLREGKFVEAAELVEKVQLEAGFGPLLGNFKGAIIPPSSLHLNKAFWLDIIQPEEGSTKNYLRWLDLLNGKITVQWENDKGAFTREIFAAYQGDVIVQRFTAPKGALDAEFIVKLPDSVENGGMPFRGMAAPEKCSHELDLGENLITLKWAYCPEYGRKGYVSVIRFLRQGGMAETTSDGVRISGADHLLMLVKTVKFEEDFTFACAKSVIDELEAITPDYEGLLQYNREYIGSRMERSRIYLGNQEDYCLSTEELLLRTHTDVEFDPMLLEKLYDMGRFYLITDTGNIPPMWGQHNINTNLQVCAGNNTGLFDEMDVYFRYYESKFDDFRINARKLFGARGLLASIHCDYNSGLYYHFSKTYPHYCWTGCLGWVFNELWGYYLIKDDKEFLKNRIVPALKEIALFYEDYACDRGPDGQVIFYPSFSPENPTPEYSTQNGVYAASINSVMDIMICREVLDNLIEACNTLGIEQENIPHWQAQKESLPHYLLDEEGGLKEWAWPTVNENYDHRHVSHHYDVWPGHVITWEDQPELARAILISNRKRAQQDDSAHGIIHRLFTAIRLKDIHETVHNLYQLMNHGFVTRALHTNHFPYRGHFPDLQGAMPAILLEMCVYSAPGTVEFLPAMPASLAKGAIEGIWLYTWAKLEHMDWCEKGLNAVLVSTKTQKLVLRCRRRITSFIINGKEVIVNGNYAEYNFEKDEKIEVKVTF
jgi:alpha-L-fucosidase 2